MELVFGNWKTFPWDIWILMITEFGTFMCIWVKKVIIIIVVGVNVLLSPLVWEAQWRRLFSGHTGLIFFTGDKCLATLHKQHHHHYFRQIVFVTATLYVTGRGDFKHLYRHHYLHSRRIHFALASFYAIFIREGRPWKSTRVPENTRVDGIISFHQK